MATQHGENVTMATQHGVNCLETKSTARCGKS